MSALVNQAGQYDTVAGATTTLAITSTTLGNLLICLIGTDNTAGPPTISGVSASGNAFTQATGCQVNDAGLRMMDIWYLPNCPAGLTSVVGTYSVSSASKIIWVIEVSGCLTASPLDQVSVKTTTAGAVITGTAFTLGQNSEFVCGWFNCSGSFTTANSPWTALTATPDGNGAVYQVVTSGGSQQTSANQTPSSNYLASSVSFKDATGSSKLLACMGAGR